MRTKSVVTPLLLLFVGGSVAYMLVGESRPACCTAPSTSADLDGAVAEADQPVALRGTRTVGDVASTAASVTTPAPLAHQQIIAYYFHSTQRCRTCLAIERMAHAALAESFAAEIDSGTLEWQVLNTDDPANEHFVKDYALVASSLVLVNRRDGVPQSWVNLDRVWDYAHDEPAFKRYVTEQVQAYLEQ